MAGRKLAPAQRLALGGVAVAVFCYPGLAAAALERWQPRGVAAVVLAIALLSFALRRRLERGGGGRRALRYAAEFALIAGALVTNQALALLLFPALVNLHLAAAFAGTLRSEQSMVERVALYIQPHLPDFTRAYCRAVTALWALFFAANAAGITALALRSPQRWWLVYTSRIYFAVVVALALVEFFARKLIFRHYSRGPVDRVLATLFPAQNTRRGRRSAAYLDEMRRLGLKTD
jgi:uncharacterized membrane protein